MEDWESIRVVISNLKQSNTALQERVKELEMDKNRLDWLQCHGQGFPMSDGRFKVCCYGQQWIDETLRKAIDAAMNQSK